MVMALLLGFAVLVAAWWIVAGVADALLFRSVRIPERWAARLVPGYLPAYVRQDLVRARQALARVRTSTPED